MYEVQTLAQFENTKLGIVFLKQLKQIQSEQHRLYCAIFPLRFSFHFPVVFTYANELNLH